MLALQLILLLFCEAEALPKNITHPHKNPAFFDLFFLAWQYKLMKLPFVQDAAI